MFSDKRRSVHIFIFNNKEELLVCKRPRHKRYGGQITSSAGGRVRPGESYSQGARRELREELGISSRIVDWGRFYVANKIERREHRLFVGRAEKFTPDKNEIVSCEFRKPQVVWKDLSLRPRRYAKPFHEALAHYLRCLKQRKK